MADLPTHSVEPSFAERLLAWWDGHGRKDLPWQRCPTPYRIWVSEIMLQQTQVSTVVPYFERFMARFASISTLAQADLDAVLHLWSGLGYYSRARNLHRAAQRVMREHRGILPDSQQALMALPGIGRSTAAAIAAQAYGKRAAILDGNVKRVLARHHRVAGPPSRSATLHELWRLAEEHTPTKRVAAYTQAIMDLGATVCQRSKPKCLLCPLSSSCHGLAAGDAERFPEPRSKPRKRRLEQRRFFVLSDPSGACYLEQRPATGIWGGLWSPPERTADEPLQRFLSMRRIDAAAVRMVKFAAAFRHRFSHYDLDVQPVYVQLRARPTPVRDGGGLGGRWLEPGKHRLGLSAVAAKLLQSAQSQSSFATQEQGVNR